MASSAGQQQPPSTVNDPITTNSTQSGKPSVLIIGGLGYVGRFLALYIHQNSLASTIRLVDKQLPELAMLPPEFNEACSKENFMQADASRESNLARILTPPQGHAESYDYIFNCGGETRFSQEDNVYRARSYMLSLVLGQAAAKKGCKAFIECSTGMVYAPDKTPRRESDRTKPWLRLAKWKLDAEEALGKMQKGGANEVTANSNKQGEGANGVRPEKRGLPLVVMRTAHVYGPYTGRWLGTALALARVYQDMGKDMKFLWSRDLHTACVHVEDVARALWTAAEWRSNLSPNTSVSPFQASPQDALTPFPVFNIVDHGQTSQATLAGLVTEVFKIPTTFTNALINTFARLNLDHVVDDVNDETLDPWSDMLKRSGCVGNTPLSPFMEKELLQDKEFNLNGSRFENTVGFRYKHERITKQEVEDVIESYKRMNWWP
ncbi:MAG: hypothetical protein M1820_006762 [Bogoriella megaspora]|nr:MAG: hypothetical protein M1820_006762 [Bogoriella megaspora]